MPGLQTTPPDVQTAPSPTSRGDLPDLERELRGARERVAALVHRRRPGVRRLAGPRDAMALDAERAEHDAERQVEALEDRSLLDVQLEVGRRVASWRALRARGRGRLRARRVRRGSETPSRSTSCRSSSWSRIDPAAARRAEQAAAEAGAFLVGPVDEPHGHGRRPFRGDPAHDLDARHDVQAAVEPAAVRHRVDVPADQQLARPSRRAA